MPKRMLLFQWDQAKAEQTAKQLRELGWEVEVESEDGGRGSKSAKANPPDLLVFFLDEKASHSRATAEHLAEAKATREIPMIFAGGDGDTLSKAKAKFPKATFTAEEDLPKIVKVRADIE